MMLLWRKILLQIFHVGPRVARACDCSGGDAWGPRQRPGAGEGPKQHATITNDHKPRKTGSNRHRHHREVVRTLSGGVADGRSRRSIDNMRVNSSGTYACVVCMV